MSVSESLALPEAKDLVAKLDEVVDDLSAGLADRGLFAKLRLDEILPRSRSLVAKALSLPAQTRKGAIAPALAEFGREFEGLAQIVVDRLPAPLAELTPLRAPAGSQEPVGSWNLAAITGALLSAGPLHFLVPKPFDMIVPPNLPGSPRLWTYLSGLAEIGVGALLVVPRTRRLGGLAAASLFAAVYPANVQMAKDLNGKGLIPEAIAYGRLPLQFPLIWGALKIAITGK